MEINMNVDSSAQITQSGAAQGEAARTHPNTLRDADVIKGHIIDIRSDKVTVRLSDGSDITGTIDNASGLRIGDLKSFKVSLNDNRLILTNMTGGEDILNSKILGDILRSFGLKPSPENMRMLEMLIQNQLPANEENLKLINQAFKLFGADGPDKILFFLENQIKLNTKNANMLQSFAEHKTALGSQLDRLFNSILDIGDNNLKNQIISDLLSYRTAGTYEPLPHALNSPPSKTDILPSGNQPAESILKSAPDNSAEKAGPLNSAKNVLSGSVNKNEIIEITKSLIKAFPQYEAQITDMADNALEKLSALTEKILLQAENQTLNLNTLKNTIKESGLGDLVNLPVFDKAEALRLISLLFPGKSDVASREKILNSLELLKDNSSIKEALLRKFAIKPENLTKDEFNALIEELNENLENIKEKLGEGRHMSKAAADIREIRESLSFLSHMKNNIFIQIPLMINENQSTGELYVFRDKRKKNKNGSDVSALIALDTVNLGRFEAYIVKRGSQVYFQFRLDNDECENIIKENIHKLNDALNARSLTISGISYKKITESFNLLDKEPAEDAGEEKPLELSRIIFDKRM